MANQRLRCGSSAVAHPNAQKSCGLASRKTSVLQGYVAGLILSGPHPTIALLARNL